MLPGCPTYVTWRRDPYSVAIDAFSITWSKEFHYAFPPFCLIRQVLNKIQKGKTKKKIILITPCWQTQLWYPQILSMLVRKPVILPLWEKPLTNSSVQTLPLVTNQTLILLAWIVSADICLRKDFLLRQPVLSSILSLSDFESSWKKWSDWCDRRAVNPFQCILISILDYLTSLFEEGLEYNTIGVHRSAISAYHEGVDEIPGGQHPLVTSLTAGIFNPRTPQPRYIFVWDVQVVLNFIKKDWPYLVHWLIRNWGMLLSSTTARVSGLQHLDVRYVTGG